MQPLPGKCAMTAPLFLVSPLAGKTCVGIHSPAKGTWQEDLSSGHRHWEPSFGRKAFGAPLGTEESSSIERWVLFSVPKGQGSLGSGEEFKQGAP